MGDAVLGVDFGTSNTAAVLHRDGRAQPLLFDGSPLLPSAVYLDPGAGLLVGKDAERAAGGAPARFEPNPKRRIDDGTIWLDEQEITVVDAIGAVLHRAAAEAARVAGSTAGRTVLTHPAGWGGQRMQVLAAAAARAQLPDVRFVPEPVAAASYFTTVLGRHVPVGRSVVVYDFGGGTFDVAVVLRTGDGFEVLAADGLPHVGGLDLDAAIVAHVRAGTAEASEAWGRLDWPQSAADRRARRLLWEDVRAAKEQLSRHPIATLHVPLAETDRHVTREEFEKLAHPVLNQTVVITIATLRAARIGRETVSDIFLVGGSSRVPLAASMLHRALGIAPTVIEQPELVVSAGAPHAVRPAIGTARAHRPAPAPPPPAPPPPTPPPPAPLQPPSPAPAAPLNPPPPATAPAAPPPASQARTASPPAPIPPATAPAHAAPIPVPAMVPVTGRWPPMGPFQAPAQPARPGPPRPASPDAAAQGSPLLLRVAGWAALLVGVLFGLVRLAYLLERLGSIDFWPWLGNSTAALVSTAISMTVAVLVWRLTRTGGAPAWCGAGLLVGYGLLALAGLPSGFASIPSTLDRVRHADVAFLGDVLFVAVAALAAVALIWMRPPPSGPPRRPDRRWVVRLAVGAVAGSVGYLMAFFSSDLFDGSDYFEPSVSRAIPTAVLAVALPLYGVLGRPAAFALGLLASWFTAVLPLTARLFSGWAYDGGTRPFGLFLFGAAGVAVGFAASRCLASDPAKPALGEILAGYR